MLVNTETDSPRYTELGDDDIEEAVGALSVAGQSASIADQSSVVASSSSVSSAGACCQAQSMVSNAFSVQAYVPLSQLVDCISPYTAVDTA